MTKPATKAQMARLAAWCVALLLLATAAYGQRSIEVEGVPTSETRVALVIANGKYPKVPLANPEVDAGKVVPALQAMGFSVTAVFDADVGTFDTVLANFVERAKGADIALFYYAGHGFALDDGLYAGNYLMAVDADVTVADVNRLRRQGVALESVIDRISRVAKTTLVFIDACRNDPLVRAGSPEGRGFYRSLGKLSANVFVGLSTRLGDVAADGDPGEGSPFARAFAEKMTVPGRNLVFAFNDVRLAVERETNFQRPEAARVDLDDPESTVLVAALREPAEPARPGADPGVEGLGVVGIATGDIEGDRTICRKMECALGNLVADAQLDRVAEMGVTVSIVNGGILRATIDAGEITMSELFAALPFALSLSTFEISGADLLASLENGVSQHEEGAGRFPQVAGLRYSFDPAAPVGSRVGDVFVNVGRSWLPLVPTASYGVVTNNLAYEGLDGYDLLARNPSTTNQLSAPLQQIVADYIARLGGAYTPYTDGRITQR